MQAVCGLSRHLGFTKRGELGRVEEGGGVGDGEGFEITNVFRNSELINPPVLQG